MSQICFCASLRFCKEFPFSSASVIKRSVFLPAVCSLFFVCIPALRPALRHTCSGEEPEGVSRREICESNGSNWILFGIQMYTIHYDLGSLTAPKGLKCVQRSSTITSSGILSALSSGSNNFKLFRRRNGDVYSAPGSKSSVGVHTFAVSNVLKKFLLLERLGGSDPAAELLASRAETVRPIIRRSDPMLHPCDCRHYDDEHCSIGIHWVDSTASVLY